jgi:tetratricopeptide (TPR) repeat protein
MRLEHMPTLGLLMLALLAPPHALAGQAAPAPATTATPAAAQPGAGPDALQLLLDQANFWRIKSQPTQAREALGRALALAPDNATALGMLGQIQSEQGEDAAAKATLARLKAAHPDDPAVTALTQSIRTGRIDPADLAEARRLARDGRGADAVKRYQAIFKGEAPPPGLALEYYLTLGGTEGGFGTAQSSLQKIVDTNPQDTAAALALAQLETYHEDSRSDGITRLQALTTKPDVAAAAKQSLRQALLWLPEDDTSVPALQSYLAQNPTDAKVKAKLEAAQASAAVVVDEGGQARIAGFEALQAGKIAEAEAKFAFALTKNPQDADAMGGMGLVRFRQKKVDEARKLLAAAAQLEPTWEQALKDASVTPSNGRSGPPRDYGAEIAGQYRQVQTLTNAGRYAEAEQLLTKLAGANANEGTYLQLADIKTRAGRLAEAEANLRRAATLAPQDAAPQLGLASLLQKKGDLKGAEAILAGITPATPAVLAARADLLRRRADSLSDTNIRAALLLQAVQLQPNDVWGRLDLARLYDSQGRTREADQLMRGVGDGPNPTGDALKAAIVWAGIRNDSARQYTLIRAVPPAERTADMKDTLARVTLRAQLDQMLSTEPRSRLRNQLLQMAAMPDPTGIRVPEIARVFIRLGEKLTARESIVIAQDAGHGLTTAQRISYGGALLEAGFDSDVEILLRPLAREVLPDPLQGAYDRLRNGLAIRQADHLNQKGDPQAAYATLLPRLHDEPRAPDLNLALARVYQADSKPREAEQISQGVLNQNPNDPDIRRAAIDTAIGAGNYHDAELLVEQAKQQAPNDPKTWLAAADLDRSRNRTAAALDDLQRARQLRAQQLQAAAAQTAP